MAFVHKPTPDSLVYDSGTLAMSKVAKSSEFYEAPRLRELRRARVLSQAQLAANAGVGRSVVVRLEAGGVARAESIHKLAGYLGVTAAELTQPPAT